MLKTAPTYCAYPVSKTSSSEDAISNRDDDPDEQVGVSNDVEVGGSVDQRASWNASLGVRVILIKVIKVIKTIKVIKVIKLIKVRG